MLLRKTCCALKEEGGLGIRNLNEWNQAAVLYQIWRIAQPSSNSLWIRWIKECLFHKKHFWTTDFPQSCPWNVRQMLNMREVASRHLSYEIGLQSNFSLWHDPWLSPVPLITRYGRSTIFVMDSSHTAMVNSIIDNGRWTPSLSNDMNARTIRESILTVHIHPLDATLWDGAKHVNISAIWHSIRRRHSAPPWLPAVWHEFSVPKCSFFVWLALQSSLLTKDKLIDYGYNISPTCIMCNSAEESCRHLFSYCPFIYIILRECPVQLRTRWSDWQLGEFFCDPCSRIEQLVGFLYISFTVYVVWRERNSRIHNPSSRPQTLAQIIHVIKRSVREKLHTCPKFQRQLSKSPHLLHMLY